MYRFPFLLNYLRIYLVRMWYKISKLRKKKSQIKGQTTYCLYFFVDRHLSFKGRISNTISHLHHEIIQSVFFFLLFKYDTSFRQILPLLPSDIKAYRRRQFKIKSKLKKETKYIHWVWYIRNDNLVAKIWVNSNNFAEYQRSLFLRLKNSSLLDVNIIWKLLIFGQRN